MTKPLRTAAAKQILANAAHDLGQLQKHWPAAYEIATDHTPGYPTTASGGGSHGTTHADPTAVRALHPEPDPRHSLSDQLRTAAALLRALASTVQTMSSRAPTAKPDTECALCAQHVAIRVAVYNHITVTNPDNDLKKRIPLCSWHHDIYQRFDVLAGPGITRLHHNGKTMRSYVMQATFAAEHPDAFAAHLAKSKSRI